MYMGELSYHSASLLTSGPGRWRAIQAPAAGLPRHHTQPWPVFLFALLDPCRLGFYNIRLCFATCYRPSQISSCHAIARSQGYQEGICSAQLASEDVHAAMSFAPLLLFFVRMFIPISWGAGHACCHYQSVIMSVVPFWMTVSLCNASDRKSKCRGIRNAAQSQ